MAKESAGLDRKMRSQLVCAVATSTSCSSGLDCALNAIDAAGSWNEAVAVCPDVCADPCHGAARWQVLPALQNSKHMLLLHGYKAQPQDYPKIPMYDIPPSASLCTRAEEISRLPEVNHTGVNASTAAAVIHILSLMSIDNTCL